MTETSKLKKYLMWYKINELNSKHLNKTQIARILDINRCTVRKYLRMTEEEFMSSESYNRKYGHKLDAYENFVVNELRKWPFLSAPQIHDHLKENFSNLPDVTEKTVFNFVRRVRVTHGISKESEASCRPYEKQPETPYGKYAQVDFGERWMKDEREMSVKVYFFAMSMSRSRQKFLLFSKKPFTTAKAIYAHELAFQFYGGVPEKLIYDQDRLFIVNENYGSLILTRGFRSMVRNNKVEVIFCRKSDPESKGKIENVVKYVKNNFLSGRLFVSEEALNCEATAWLERTGNGTMHHGTRKIPAEEFAIEKNFLRPYTGVPKEPEETLSTYHVHKDNTITYHGNYYTVPTGTYTGHGTKIYVEEIDSELHLYDVETGKTIAVHKLAMGKGELVRNKAHLRDKSKSLEEYQEKMMHKLPDSEDVRAYLAALRTDRPRYFRDNLDLIVRKAPRYSQSTIKEAFARCLEMKVFNASNLMEVAETLRRQRGEQLLDIGDTDSSLPQAQTTGLEPEKTPISSFGQYFAS